VLYIYEIQVAAEVLLGARLMDGGELCSFQSSCVLA